jgi:hypothetical protein
MKAELLDRRHSIFARGRPAASTIPKSGDQRRMSPADAVGRGNDVQGNPPPVVWPPDGKAADGFGRGQAAGLQQPTIPGERATPPECASVDADARPTCVPHRALRDGYARSGYEHLESLMKHRGGFIRVFPATTPG